MENASKALIIAGAILISIVLITLGVVILGQGQDVVNNSNMDAQAISSWNSQFTQYVGDNVPGSKVNALMDSVVANNIISNRNGDINKVIFIYGTLASGASSENKVEVDASLPRIQTDGGRGSNGAKAVIKKAKSGALYNVTVGYNPAGYVCEIKIEAIKK